MSEIERFEEQTIGKEHLPQMKDATESRKMEHGALRDNSDWIASVFRDYPSQIHPAHPKNPNQIG